MWQMLRGEGLRRLGAWNGVKNTQVSVSLGARAWRPEPVKEAPADVQGEFRESPGCRCSGRVPRASWVQMSGESSSRVLGWQAACSRGGSRSLGRDGPGPRAISCSCVTPQTHRNNTFAPGHIPLNMKEGLKFAGTTFSVLGNAFPPASCSVTEGPGDPGLTLLSVTTKDTLPPRDTHGRVGHELVFQPPRCLSRGS